MLPGLPKGTRAFSFSYTDGVSSLLLLALLTVQAPAADWKALPIDSYPDEARTQIAAARDAALRQPARGDAYGQFALVLHAWEQYEPAARAYAEARRLAPSTVDWWALAGTLAVRTGRHDLAAEYFGKAAALSPSPLLTIRHADALLDSGQLDAAKDAYTRAVKMPDLEPAARYGLGRIALAHDDVGTARAEFERALALFPEFGAAHYALAQVQRRAGDLAGARASLARQQACLACWPVPTDVWAARLAAVRSDAAALMQQGLQSAGADDAQAIRLHEQALVQNRSLVQAHVNLITLYARTGNLPKAEAHYRAVLDAGTQLAEAHHAYGLALLALKEPARAEPVLRLAVEGNPQDADAHNALGLILETTKRTAEAEAAYGRAVAANPALRGLRFNHARVLVALGRLDEAAAELARLATPADAESAQYVFAASGVALRRGDRAAARTLAEEALARARKHGLTDLAAAIDRGLATLR